MRLETSKLSYEKQTKRKTIPTTHSRALPLIPANRISLNRNGFEITDKNVYSTTGYRWKRMTFSTIRIFSVHLRSHAFIFYLFSAQI